MSDLPRKRFVTDMTLNSLHSCFTDIELLKKSYTTSTTPLTEYQIAMIADNQLKHVGKVKKVADNVFRESEKEAAESLIQLSGLSSASSSPSASPIYMRFPNRDFE